MAHDVPLLNCLLFLMHASWSRCSTFPPTIDIIVLSFCSLFHICILDFELIAVLTLPCLRGEQLKQTVSSMGVWTLCLSHCACSNQCLAHTESMVNVVNDGVISFLFPVVFSTLPFFSSSYSFPPLSFSIIFLGYFRTSFSRPFYSDRTLHINLLSKFYPLSFFSFH